MVSRSVTASASRSKFSSSWRMAAAPMPPSKYSPKPYAEPNRSRISRNSWSSAMTSRGLMSLNFDHASCRRSTDSSVYRSSSRMSASVSLRSSDSIDLRSASVISRGTGGASGFSGSRVVATSSSQNSSSTSKPVTSPSRSQFTRRSSRSRSSAVRMSRSLTSWPTASSTWSCSVLRSASRFSKSTVVTMDAAK